MMLGIVSGIVFLMVVGAAWTLPAFGADGPLPPAPAIADVALAEGGLLVGQVVDPQGAPKANLRISLQDSQNKEVATAKTDQQGAFAISGLKGGVYQVVTPQGRRVYRLWSPGMAPPSAQRGTLIVLGDELARGAASRGGMRAFLTNPIVIGGAVATAIAVPVAIHNSRRDHPESP
jgi:hypothetical protein